MNECMDCGANLGDSLKNLCDDCDRRLDEENLSEEAYADAMAEENA